MTNNSSITVLASNNILGEGLHISSTGVFWLDIIKSQLFVLKDSGIMDAFTLPEQASAILKVQDNIVFLASISGICSFNLVNQDWSVISSFSEPLGHTMRANDGAKIDDVRCLFGTMEKNPTGLEGALYVSTPSTIRKLYDGIGIPNTFIKLSDQSFLISDSLLSHVYMFTFNAEFTEILKKHLWLDLSNEVYTPDGGCIDKDGNIYIAMWGGACINKYDCDGNLIQSIEVPALKPTNCKLSFDKQSLLVTTATEGMADEDLKKYPMSGSLLEIRID